MKLPWSQPKDPAVADYLAATPRRVKRKTPVSGTNFVILDVETTGFQIHADKLLSVAVIPVRNGCAEVGKARSWLFQQTETEVTDATKIHTILPSDATKGTPEKQVLQELLPHLANAIIVGHHINFDLAMLNIAYTRNFGMQLRDHTVDTAILSMQVLDSFRRTGYSSQRPPSFDEVCTKMGIKIWERHTADGDAFATSTLFLLLCAKLRRKFDRELLLKDLPLG